MQTNRRGFLKSLAIGAGVLGASRVVPGMRLLEPAHAAPGAEPSAIFIVNLIGGYNALFPSADSFLTSGAFGVTSTNIRRIGTSPVYVDRNTLGTLSATTLNKMASVGIRHGISSHPTAQRAMIFDNTTSRLVKLASTMGGDAAVRCVALGNLMPTGTHRAIGDVSLQQVRDLSTTIAALGGSTSPNAPDRAMAAEGIAAAEALSKGPLTANPGSGRSLTEAYPAASAQLRQNTVALDYAEMTTAYGIQTGTNGSLPTAVDNPRRAIMGAELMIRAGAKVVFFNQGGWDSHGDRDGSEVRTKIVQNGTMAALKTFTDRTLAMTDKNVVTVVMGDFSRSLPGSDHQANLTATVMGKYVKLGTSGRVSAQVGLPVGTPGIDGFWAYLAAITGATGSPFGANPHAALVGS